MSWLNSDGCNLAMKMAINDSEILSTPPFGGSKYGGSRNLESFYSQEPIQFGIPTQFVYPIMCSYANFNFKLEDYNNRGSDFGYTPI